MQIVMTPKEKARELVDKYDNTLTYLESKSKAKQCAMIAVDEIINSRPAFPYPYEVEKHVNGIFNIINYPIEYWQEVKQEIKNL